MFSPFLQLLSASLPTQLCSFSLSKTKIKTNKQRINKIKKNANQNKMKPKVYKIIITDLVLCWLTTPGHGAFLECG